VLLGIVKKTGGEAQLFGRPAGDRQGRLRVGYLPEHHRIPRHLTGNTALEYYGGLSNIPLAEIRRKRDELLDMVGLGDWGKVCVKKYSKGMQQRLGLAQTLIHEPDLLILDEPTDGVDPVGRAEMREILSRQRSEGKTIFLNSHLLQEVELICDRVAILDHGIVRRVGPVSELTSRQTSQVEFTVLADETAARGALGERPGVRLAGVSGGQTQIIAPIQGDDDINTYTDALRAAGLTITGISRDRQTLEQAFIDIVTQEPPQS
jgi:ABC-2 type transport system ATP-binding protein